MRAGCSPLEAIASATRAPSDAGASGGELAGSAPATGSGADAAGTGHPSEFNRSRYAIGARFGLDSFSQGYRYMGLNRSEKPAGWWFRDYAPGALAGSLVGDFNAWDEASHRMTKNSFGVWSVFVPDFETGSAGGVHSGAASGRASASGAMAGGASVLKHLDHYKVMYVVPEGSPGAKGQETRAASEDGFVPRGAHVLRVPAWATYAEPDKKTEVYCGRIWNPPSAERYSWRFGGRRRFRDARVVH